LHSAVEAALERRCGDAALRLHTGRSRNDQVATLLRMEVMQLCDDCVEHVREVERALVTQAAAAKQVAVAAYTHLQPAQPVLLAHVWLAHVAAFERDEERFMAARAAADGCRSARRDRRFAAALRPPGTRGAARLQPRRRQQPRCRRRSRLRRRVTWPPPRCSACISPARRRPRAVVLARLRLVSARRVSTGSSLLPNKRNPTSRADARQSGAPARETPSACRCC